MVLAQTSVSGSLFANYSVWLRNRKLSLSTVNQYTDRVRHFISWWGNTDNTHLTTREDLLQYQEETFEVNDAMPRTLFKAFAALRSWFNYLMEQGLIAVNPAQGLPLHTVVAEDKETPRATSEEGQKILSVINTTTFRGSRDAVMVRILLDTCIKVSELLSIEPAHIDCAAGTIAVKCRKKAVIHKITADTVSEIRRHLSQYAKESRQGLFITKTNGQRITRQGAWKAIRAYTKLAGIENSISPSSFVRPNTFTPEGESLADRVARLRRTRDLLGR